MRIAEMVKQGKMEIGYRNGEEGIIVNSKKFLTENVNEIKANKSTIIEFIKATEKGNKTRINQWFENLNNVEVKCIQSSKYYLSKETIGYKEMEGLNESYFFQQEQEWIKENVKSFKLVEERVVPYESTVRIYSYKKNEKTVVVSTKKLSKTQVITLELQEMAEVMTDEQFEDATGCLREHYKI